MLKGWVPQLQANDFFRVDIVHAAHSVVPHTFSHQLTGPLHPLRNDFEPN